MTDFRTPKSELNDRIERFRKIMDNQNPDWEMAVFFSKINLLYFIGSMPEGMLIIERNGKNTMFVRRSYERTVDESNFETIISINSYKDASSHFQSIPNIVYLETEIVPLAMLLRFQKYFPFKTHKALDLQIAYTRAVKSTYELDLMIQSGHNHRIVLEEKVPLLLKEGITEAEFATELYKTMVEEGHQGIARFGMFDTEMVVGQIGFGENSLYPTNFNGPGGHLGMSPAVPILGSRQHLLKKGDLVFVDIGMGFNGYHTDKTMVYMFGQSLPDYAIQAHKLCVELQHRIAEQLKPGNIPSEIYESEIARLDSQFLNNFMGFENRQVKFLGHGIGLTIDELPVIAKGFDEPLHENMVFAIEPKKGIPGIGMVGIEDTFIVTPNGGLSITGKNSGLMLVK